MEFKALLQKYDIPVPRYTSYPSVPFWEGLNSEQWISHLSASLADPHASAGLYVHIPFCKSLCSYCGCNKRITRNPDVGQPYVEDVLKEWELYRNALGFKKISVSELHLGGGTPTFLRPDELAFLMEGLGKYIQGENTEYSIEADPRTTSKEHIATLYCLGFRRLSMGIQDFDSKVQEAVNRVQSQNQVRELTDYARETGFESINYDLIYGLPFQTPGGLEETLNEVISQRPDRIAFYSYAHVPWIKPSQRRFTEEDLPKGDKKRALYELGRNILEAAGYREIGMDHFALETDSLWKALKEKTLHRNFMGYVPRQTTPLIGLGVSSIGESEGAFAQNEKRLEDYRRRVKAGEIPISKGHELTQEDLVLRHHIIKLATQFETSWEDPIHYTEFIKEVPGFLSELARDGLVEVSDNGIKIPDRGKPFLRVICSALDARFRRRNPDNELFSQSM